METERQPETDGGESGGQDTIMIRIELLSPFPVIGFRIFLDQEKMQENIRTLTNSVQLHTLISWPPALDISNQDEEKIIFDHD